MGRKKKEPIKRLCGFCEKEFIVSRHNNYFCCHTCAAFKSAHGSSLRKLGEENPNSKLNDSDIRGIFYDYSLDQFSYKELACKYLVSIRTISFILKRLIWNHIEIPQQMLEEVRSIQKRKLVNSKEKIYENFEEYKKAGKVKRRNLNLEKWLIKTNNNN